MHIFLRQCTAEDIDTLLEFSIRTYYETFIHMNAPKNMDAYLKDAFDAGKLCNELNDMNSIFYFLYYDEKLAGYLKLNETPSQTDINDKLSLEIESSLAYIFAGLFCEPVSNVFKS